jgi:biopolymer transport protein ExbD
MAMSIGKDSSDENAPMNEINTTPLVDVMLVLLIIFLITVPVVIQTVPLPTTTKPENVLISVDGNCDTYWGQTRVESKQELLDRGVKALKDEIKRQESLGGKIELPEVHIRGDKDVAYRCIGGVVFTMQRAGFLKVGFISEPIPGFVTR